MMRKTFSSFFQQNFLMSTLVVLALIYAYSTETYASPATPVPEDIISEARSSYAAMTPLAGTPDDVAGVVNRLIPAEAPLREIPVRIYSPITETDSNVNLPVFLFTHGGGFVSGDLDTHDVLLRAVSNGAQCIVVSVDYRLAPENPFPAALEDVYTVLLWLRDNAASIGGDASRIVVGGDSAGGNLAASVAILNRDRAGVPLAGQWLMYPTLNGDKMDTESWIQHGGTYFPGYDVQKMVIKAYVPHGTDPNTPLIAPLMAEHVNLPAALIQVGGLDPLRDESREYALSLQNASIDATYMVYMKLQHGFLQFYKNEDIYPNADIALEQGLTWLRRSFGE